MLVNDFCDSPEHGVLDLYPQSFRSNIDNVNSWIYDNINNGVYKAGFATTQEAYNKAVTALFEHLDKVESILSTQRYLIGDRITEADIRLFTTLIRFDPVYVGHFKCNLRRIIDYPNIYHYMLELYQIPEFGSTVDFTHIKNGYYGMPHINPTGIVPIGPIQHLDEPHGRDKKFPNRSNANQ